MYGYTRFQPSNLSQYGASAANVAADAGRVTLATATTGVSVVAPMLATAGALSAIPVAGWVAAGALAGTAGVIALVGAIKGGKARKKDAVALARKLKLPEPERAPGYIVRVLRLSKAKRKKLLARYKKRVARISKRKNRLFAKARAKRLSSLRWKIRVLEALLKIENPKKMTAAERKAAKLVAQQTPVPFAEAVNEQNSPDIDPEAEDQIEAKDEAQQERQDPAVGAAPLAPGADAAEGGSGLAAIPAWGWALGAVVAIGGIVLVTRGRGKSAAKAH